MHSKMMIKKYFTLLIVLSTVFSCKKAEIDTDFKTAQDNANAENLFLDIPAQIIPIINGYSPVSNFALQNPVPSSSDAQNFTCGTISVLSTFDTTTNSYGFPFEFEINYGNNCTSPFDNKVRKGKITVSLNNYWDSTGTTATVTFNNYYVSNIELSGTINLTFTDETHFTFNVLEGKFTTNTYNITFNTSKSIFYKAGYATDTIISDDSYKISGNSYGYDRTGRPFTTNTITSFIKDASCGWIASGVFEITPEGLSTRTVDYGDSTCDNKATVIINGNTFDLELK